MPSIPASSSSTTQHYPLLTRLFAELGVAHAADHDELFGAGCRHRPRIQRRQPARTVLPAAATWCSPRFWRMLADLRRFYREAPALLAQHPPGPTLGEYLHENDYSAAFRDDHLVPMASALWSSPARRILDFPAVELVRFMANHHMLQVSGRPQWRVVSGGSQRYVRRDARAAGRSRSASIARSRSVRRHGQQVSVSQRGRRGIASTRSCSPAMATRRSPCSPTPATPSARSLAPRLPGQRRRPAYRRDACCRSNRARLGRMERACPGRSRRAMHGQLLDERPAIDRFRASR